jgi:ribonuclease-3
MLGAKTCSSPMRAAHGASARRLDGSTARRLDGATARRRNGATACRSLSQSSQQTGTRPDGNACVAKLWQGRSEMQGEEVNEERKRLDRAEEILGRTFVDRARLLSALTHRSYLNEHASGVPHNEVLEFLGDAVLSLVVVEALIEASPYAAEGELTERRAAHVSTAKLAETATTSGLVSLLRTGKSLAQGVSHNAAADVVEAVLGAAYLEGGLPAARVIVQRLLGPPPAHAPRLNAHAKKDLQELVQGAVGRAPTYVVAHREGPNHAPVFAARVLLEDVELGHGEGSNKRLATEAAAAHALTALTGLPGDALRARLGGDLRPRGRR